MIKQWAKEKSKLRISMAVSQNRWTKIAVKWMDSTATLSPVTWLSQQRTFMTWRDGDKKNWPGHCMDVNVHVLGRSGEQLYLPLMQIASGACFFPLFVGNPHWLRLSLELSLFCFSGWDVIYFSISQLIKLRRKCCHLTLSSQEKSFHNCQDPCRAVSGGLPSVLPHVAPWGNALGSAFSPRMSL